MASLDSAPSDGEYRAVLSDGDEDEDLSSGEKLLKYSRNGELSKVSHLITSCGDNDLQSIINCKGSSKANRDWTPLHLASYFGHTPTVELLLQHGAEVNAINDKADTPLHKAAYTGRLDAVTLLLKTNADVNLVNIEGKTPIKLAKTSEIHDLIEAAQLKESSENEKKFLKLVTEGDILQIESMMKECKGLNINCVDDHGNNALHLAAYKDRQQIAAFLMQAGVKSDIRNENNHLPIDVTSSSGMKQVLNLTPLSDLCKTVTRFEGELFKKTRVFGFKPKYVVLDRGVLSIFNTLADASSGAKRRTYKYLDDAQCLIQSRDNLGIAVVYNTGATHLFRVQSVSDDSSENISRQKWVNAIRSHIAYSTYYMHKGLEASDDFEDLIPISSMSDALQTAQAHQSSIEKEVNSLCLTTATVVTSIPNLHKQGFQDVVTKCNNIASSSRDMCNVLQHCLTLFTQQEQLRSEQLSEEREKCRVLQESLRVLAIQHYELEQQIETSGGYSISPPTLGEEDTMSCASIGSSDDEFYECDVSDKDESPTPQFKSHPDSEVSVSDSLAGASSNASSEEVMNYCPTDIRKLRAINKHMNHGRDELPVPMISRNDFSVWSILKQCIGKELSKITMPVVFNEPISFLQRITEYMEYSYLLERANVCETPEERMANVAAFAVSACASNWDRLGKPFNPLLGETYELNKEELGYKVVCEQVSHHPPVSAFHVSATDYRVHGAINPKLKFWGKSVEITPKGVVTVELIRHGEVYTWENVNCSVHNIIVGKLWVEHHGRMEIVNHKTGHRADISFKKSNMFSREVHKLEGSILDNKDNRLLMLYGSWTDAMFSVPPTHWDAHLRQEKPKARAGLVCVDMMKSIGKSLSLDNGSDSSDMEMPKKPSSFDLKIPGQTFLWQADDRPANCDKYYSFTKFAMMLNELDDETMKAKLAPTDSRLRPDIRSLELGNIDQAAEKKVYLEEKQRNTRKEMKKNKEEWSPRWFNLSPHPKTGKPDWIYQDEYWSEDWSKCPDIF